MVIGAIAVAALTMSERVKWRDPRMCLDGGKRRGVVTYQRRARPGLAPEDSSLAQNWK